MAPRVNFPLDAFNFSWILASTLSSKCVPNFLLYSCMHHTLHAGYVRSSTFYWDCFICLRLVRPSMVGPRSRPLEGVWQVSSDMILSMVLTASWDAGVLPTHLPGDSRVRDLIVGDDAIIGIRYHYIRMVANVKCHRHNHIRSRLIWARRSLLAVERDVWRLPDFGKFDEHEIPK